MKLFLALWRRRVASVTIVTFVLLSTVIIYSESIAKRYVGARESRFANGSKTFIAEPVLTPQPPFTHVFELENETDSTVSLMDPVRGCGCSEASLNQRELKPKEIAFLTVSVNLPDNFLGKKKLTTTVSSTLGKRWDFTLIVPIVPTLIVPKHVNIELTDLGGGATAKGDIFLECTAASFSSLPQSAPTFACALADLEISPGKVSESVTNIEGSDFFTRRYNFELRSTSSRSAVGNIAWTAAGTSRVSHVNISAPTVVAVQPRRFVLNEHTGSGEIAISLQFVREGYSAKILNHPDYLQPCFDTSSTLATDSVLHFSISRIPNIARVDEIDFRIYRGNQAVGVTTVPIVCNSPPLKDSQSEN